MGAGMISVGGDILVAEMTVDQAKLKCLELPNCQGFCYAARSEPDETPVIYFKDKCDTVSDLGTTYKVKRTARAGLDTNHDGLPNVIVEGTDKDGDGIPDILQVDL